MRLKLLVAKKHTKRRQKYQLKKALKKNKKIRILKLFRWKNQGTSYSYNNATDQFPPTNIQAPKDFKFIDNTDAIISYVYEGRQILKSGKAVRFDISKIDSLSPDAITILISHLISFRKYNITIFGNAPDDLDMRKKFTESGFYNYVRSSQKYKSSDETLMHKESNLKVKPDIAESATRLIVQNGFYTEENIEAIYNIFIEMMSNTHHHASPKKYGDSKWMLHVYNDKEKGVTSVCFLDLGVGIFKSIIIRRNILQLGLKSKIVKYSYLVNDLLSGALGSRISMDNEIRGKGIPQIFEYSKLPFFQEFYLITNDVKVNLKTGEKVDLKNDFFGTFYYFEICSKHQKDANS